MATVVDYLFIILPLFLIENSNAPFTDLTVCENGDDSLYTKKVMFDKRICYFVVANATERVHDICLKYRGTYQRIPEELPVEIGNTSDLEDMPGIRSTSIPQLRLWFNYSFNEARQICCEHNATLLIIHNKHEMKFIKSNFSLTDFYPSRRWQRKYIRDIRLNGFALGLNVLKRPYIWDDGTAITFEPEKWSTDLSDDREIGEYAFLDEYSDKWAIIGTNEWKWNLTEEISGWMVNPLGIVCQQTKPQANIEICKIKIDNIPPTTTESTTKNDDQTTDSGGNKGACFVQHKNICLTVSVFLMVEVILGEE